MSTKEAVIALIQGLPDDITPEAIVATLQAQYGIKPPEQDWSGEVTDEDWRQFVAHGLRAELADEREDIYTLEDGDGLQLTKWTQLKANMAMKLEDVLQAKREQILALAARHGAHNIRIFGSVARGEAGPNSDIDVLVDLDPGRSLFDLGGFLMDLQDLLGRKVAVVTEKGLHWYIRDRVLKEAMPL
jgi:uncharacterized protein